MKKEDPKPMWGRILPIYPIIIKNKMKTKEEVIKEAYNLHYNVIKNSLNDNGWLVDCHEEPIFSPSIGPIEEHEEHFWFRPKTLQGIENNNGWIKIESEDDLPKEKTVCWVKDRNQSELICGEFLNNSKEEKEYWLANATHYQPIIKPLKPLY